MTLNDLKLRARALLRPNRVEQELEEELAFHIEREARKLIDEGITPTEARERAQARFGSTALAGDRCRDERGTAVIDNTIRDVQYALRAFAKAPLAACTIVVTVAIGLGVVAVLFTVLNTLIFRVDQVPDVGEICAVERTQKATAIPRCWRVRCSTPCEPTRMSSQTPTPPCSGTNRSTSTAGGWRSRSSPGISFRSFASIRS
jgi:hypothetical protein